MRKFIVVVFFTLFVFIALDANVGGRDQLAATGADNEHPSRPGMMGILITYDSKPQTGEYKYICKIFRNELSQVLSRHLLDLPERFFKVHLKELLQEPDLDEPAITVSLDGQPICWVKISRLGTPEQMRDFARFSSELIFYRLRELSDEEDSPQPEQISL